MPVSLVTPFLLIFPGIAAGMLLRMFLVRIGRGESVPVLRRRLQTILLAAVNPVCFAVALWVLDTSRPSIFLRLPFIGLIALITGFLLGKAGSALMRLEPLQAGVWRSSASFTNIGNVGGIVVFAVIGEAGYAFIPFYKLFEELWYYSVVFPAARRDSERFYGKQTDRHPLAFAKDPFFLVSLAAIAVGMGLNLSGLERPAVFGRINAVLIPMTTLGLLVSIGLSLHLTKIGPHIKKALALTVVKFFLTPAIVCAAAILFGITPQAWPVLFGTILILSSMPAGFLSLVPPSLYRLDLDLANACWLVTMLGLVVTIPVLWFLNSLLSSFP